MRDRQLTDSGYPFGPGFFLSQLRAFARDCCPDPTEGLPSVEVHLATGEVLVLCHVIGLADRYVALAVRDRSASGSGSRMRTELVAYGLISRVTLRGHSEAGERVGFDPSHVPAVFGATETPESLLGKAAGATGSAEAEQPIASPG